SAVRKPFPGFLSGGTSPHTSHPEAAIAGSRDRARRRFRKTAPPTFRFLLPFFPTAPAARSLLREARARARFVPCTWLPGHALPLQRRSVALRALPPLPPWPCFARGYRSPCFYWQKR